MATQANQTAPTVSIIDQLINKNLELGKTSRSRVVEVEVISVSDARATSTGLPVKMVVTNLGNYWPIASSITNLPTHIPVGKPVAAKAVLTPSKDDKFLNMSSLEFEGLDKDRTNMIRLMPKGTALFALAV